MEDFLKGEKENRFRMALSSTVAAGNEPFQAGVRVYKIL